LGTSSSVNTITGTTSGGDALDLSYGTSGVTFGGGSLTGGAFTSATYSKIAGVTGTGFADSLAGTSAAETIHGGGGADTVTGGGGADFLFGENGDDIFVFANKTQVDAAPNIDGGSGINTLRFSGVVTLTDSDFAHIAGNTMQILQLTG